MCIAEQVCYRRYASLYFVVGFDGDENELALLEWIHCLVETLDSVFSNVCELDILFHHDTVSAIVDDMVRQVAYRTHARCSELYR